MAPKTSSKSLRFADILDLRKVVESLKSDFPHLPLVLELSISGFSRWSIANLEMKDVNENTGEIRWQIRRNSKIVTKFSDRQLGILQEYMEFRRNRQSKSPRVVLVRQTSRFSKYQGYFLPVKPERIRSDVRSIGREIDLPFVLEIPDIHRAVADYLLLNGCDKESIQKIYKLSQGA